MVLRARLPVVVLRLLCVGLESRVEFFLLFSSSLVGSVGFLCSLDLGTRELGKRASEQPRRRHIRLETRSCVRLIIDHTANQRTHTHKLT